MANDSRAAWGIDIGQAGLKAMKLRYAGAAGQAIAVAFDYVPHPKILSQPDAIPEELIPQALDTFLSRNQIDGDLVAISVPGKQSLARFIELPPTPPNKVRQIVEYEAKQQIPFPLEEVIWDYQTINNPELMEVEKQKLLMGAEVGLFAMKKSEIADRLSPLQDQKVEVELIQTAPVALYNMLAYDEMGWRPDQELSGGEEHFIILDMGCDDTTLIISNGEKIWIKSVRIGGNHFTRALVKELKLSFAKAEHLKCNATKAPDPKSVFQALRPVFNEFVQEIQRSVGFFSGVNRNATISKVFGLGNGFKLAGLQKFLQQNLDYEVVRPETFPGLTGDAVLNSPLFQENLLTFPISYGLALQALGAGRLNTTLLPPEIATARIIKRKKPWAVVAAGVTLAGLAIPMVVNGAAYASVMNPEFDAAIAEKGQYDSLVQKGKSSYDSQKSAFSSAKGVAASLVDGRRDTTWLEVYDAINACLPRDEVDATQLEPEQRLAVSISSVTCSHVSDVGTWYQELGEAKQPLTHPKYRPLAQPAPPSGEGYIFTLIGTSWHHQEDDYEMQKHDYVLNSLIDNLSQWTITRGRKEHAIGKAGIKFPILTDNDTKPIMYEKNRPAGTGREARLQRRQGLRRGPVQPAAPRETADGEGPRKINETKFRVEFIWQPYDEVPEADPYALPEEAAEGTDEAA